MPTTWTAAQVAVFLDATADEPLGALWWLVLLRGLRRKEVLGLRWRDVDLDRRRLRVVESKTESGRRTLVLDPADVEVLRRHSVRQGEELLALGRRVAPDDLVFLRSDGSPWPDYEPTRIFQRRAAELGLPVMRLHDGRHTAATLSLEAGVDVKFVQKQLGHANAGITRNTYQHVRDEADERAVAAVTALVSRARAARS